MSDKIRLDKPPGEIELGQVLAALQLAPELRDIVRRLAFHRDRLSSELGRVRPAARSVCDYLAAEPDCCPSLSLEARIEQLGRVLATKDHGDE